MRALLALFWSVCRLQRGPEDVPYSIGLLLLVLTLDVFLGIAGDAFADPGRLHAVALVTVLGAAADAAILWGLLRFKRLGARFVQSLTTLYGIDLLLGLLTLPVTLAGLLLAASHWLVAVVFVQMLLVGWNLGLRGFVYHRTLAISLLQGNMLSLTLFFLNVFVSVQLFPELLQKGSS